MRRPSDEGPGGKPPGPSGPLTPAGRRGPDSEYPTAPRAGKAAVAPVAIEPGVDAGDLSPGTVLGKYQIVQRLGVGGMGSVYEAVHTGIAKAVALKTMSSQLAADPRAAARFMREAAAASRLDHPHVTSVTDFGTDHGISYLVMELLRGDDLAQLITREPRGLDPTMVADVMLAICAGVFAAHESGVIHRDLKPQNIFLSRTPLGETVPKVLDFGISKMIDQEVGAALTNTGMVMGTTHYLSPEQVSGKGVDARSDQYALGVILYESLTGRRPHTGASAYEIMRSISEGSFTQPRKLRPEIPPAFEAVILRAMATRPQDRYESVHGLGRALMQLASPKRRVIWADYYDRERSGKHSQHNGEGQPLSSADARLGPGRGTPEQQGTRVLSVKPAQLSATRTHFAPEEMREAIKARAALNETRFADPPAALDSASLEVPRSAGGKRVAVVFAVAVAGLGGFLLWRSPRLRAQLPEAVRVTLDRFGAPGEAPAPAPDRATAAHESTSQAARAETPPTAAVVATSAPATPAGKGPPPTVATAPTAVDKGAPAAGRAGRVSPFSERPANFASPFDPPPPPPPPPPTAVADAGAVASVGAADAAVARHDAGAPKAAVAAESAGLADTRRAEAPVRKTGAGPITIYSEGADAEAAAAPRKRRARLPASAAAPTLPAPPPAKPQPAPEEAAPPTPDQVPARRVLPPGGAPILE
jgi:serine/threonine protein kinase